MKTQHTPEARIITALEKIAKAESAKSEQISANIEEAYEIDYQALALKHLKGHTTVAKLKKAKISKTNDYQTYTIIAYLGKRVSLRVSLEGRYKDPETVEKLKKAKTLACQKAAYAHQATYRTSNIRQIKSYLRNLYGQRSDLKDVPAKELMTSVEDFILKVTTPATCPR